MRGIPNDMKWFQTSVYLVLFPVLVFFFSPSAAEEGECDFDQAERVRTNMALLKKYPGSKYIKEEHKVVLKDGEDEITLAIGGCVHYGVLIELKTRQTKRFDNEAAFMARIVELVAKYSQGHIDTERIKKVIAEKKWNNIDPNLSNLYYLEYDEVSTFEIYRQHEDAYTIIGINYYF